MGPVPSTNADWMRRHHGAEKASLQMPSPTRRIALLLLLTAIACEQQDVGPSDPAGGRHATILVRAITLDGATLTSAFAVARSHRGRDTVRIGQTGLGDRGIDVVVGDSVELRVDVPEPRAYHASTGKIVVEGDTAIDVILIPTVWTVRLGRYRGLKRPIDVATAMGRDEDDTRFLNHFTPGREILTAWPEDALPIAVGIDVGSNRRWSALDSAWFWQSIDDFNDAAGRQIFRPASDVALSTRRVIGIRIDLDANAIAYGSLGTNLDVCKLPARLCSDVHGVVSLPRGLFFRSSFDEEYFRVFQHEMMHALGFGHGCHWSSIMMRTGPGCSIDVPRDVTVDDVAYMELVFRLASVLEAHVEAWHLDEALAAKR